MNIRNFATIFLAFSILCLAGALVFFARQIMKTNNNIPQILQTIDKVNTKVDIVVGEVQSVQKLIPTITNEAAEVRKQIPLVTEEVAKFREQIPAIVEQVNQINRQVPPVLAEMKAIRLQIPKILNEVEKTRPLVQLALDEVKHTREALPSILLQTEKVISDAKQVGKSTTEGAVTGVLTGILKTPFEIASGLGRAIFGSSAEKIEEVTPRDLELIKLATYQVLSTDKLSHSVKWTNPDSGSDGVVTFLAFVKINERDCRMLNYAITTSSKKQINEDVNFCLDEQSVWQPINQ